MANRILPDDLRRDLDRFAALMMQKGDPAAMRGIFKLKKAMAANSPVIDAHANAVAANALSSAGLRLELTDADRELIGSVLNALEEWRGGRSSRTFLGPDEEFPYRLELRMSGAERDALYRITDKTGETRSAVIRRLIRDADPSA